MSVFDVASDQCLAHCHDKAVATMASRPPTGWFWDMFKKPSNQAIRGFLKSLTEV